MKKFLFTLLILLFFASSIKAQQQFRWGVEIGVNLSHFRTDKSASTSSFRMGLGEQVGLNVFYNLSNHWTLMSSLSLTQTRSNMDMHSKYDIYVSPKTEYKLNHLVLPLEIGYKLNVNENLKLIPSFGIFYSYNFSAGKCNIDYFDYSDLDEKGIAKIKSGKWKPMDGFNKYFPSTNESMYAPMLSELSKCRKSTYGALAGVKAIIGNHYTISAEYYECVKRIQYPGLRSYGIRLSIGYLF